MEAKLKIKSKQILKKGRVLRKIARRDRPAAKLRPPRGFAYGQTVRVGVYYLKSAVAGAPFCALPAALCLLNRSREAGKGVAATLPRISRTL